MSAGGCESRSRAGYCLTNSPSVACSSRPAYHAGQLRRRLSDDLAAAQGSPREKCHFSRSLKSIRTSRFSSASFVAPSSVMASTIVSASR